MPTRFGHSTDNASDKRNVLWNTYDDTIFEGNSSFDRRHVVNIYYIYDLPFFRDQDTLARQAARRLADLGGELLPHGHADLGARAPTTSPASATAATASRCNLVGDPLANANQSFSAGNGNDQNFWFNPTAFANPAAGTFGNAPRNLIYGPGQQQWDIALFKNFGLGGPRKVQFRAEIFNFINHAEPERPELRPHQRQLRSRDDEERRAPGRAAEPALPVLVVLKAAGPLEPRRTAAQSRRQNRIHFAVMAFSVRAAGAAVAGVAAVVMAAVPDARSGAVELQAAATAAAPYTETIPGTNVSFDMVPIPGGTFTMGSPASEPFHYEDEGPHGQGEGRAVLDGQARSDVGRVRPVSPSPSGRRRRPGATPTGADAVSKPTPPYADESWGFGKDKQPALGMTWHAAAEYCRWLSAKTGKTYRLATEAEWEYAARAGTTTPWSSGATPETLGDVAWYAANSGGKPHLGGQKKPNAFGLFDMHGNVAEWVIDQHEPKRYATPRRAAVAGRSRRSPCRGRRAIRTSCAAAASRTSRRCCAAPRAARSDPEWSRRDPQLPQSIWWHTDAIFVGFRIVRPVEETPALKDFQSKITRQSPDYGQ